MKTYAYVNDGKVMQILKTDEDITTMFHPDLLWVDVTDLNKKPAEGWTYDGTGFAKPVEPEKTPGDVLALNTSTRDWNLSRAALFIGPLQDAVDLGEATEDETEALETWKRFRVAVNRTDLTADQPEWPQSPA